MYGKIVKTKRSEETQHKLYQVTTANTINNRVMHTHTLALRDIIVQ